MNMELYILALAGVVVHYLKDYAGHHAKGLVYGWNKVLPTVVLSIITSVILVYLKDDIASLYVLTPASSFVAGYFGNSILFSFIEAKKPINNN